MNASLKVFRTMQAIVACGLLISFFISPSAVSARGGFKGGGGHGGGGRPGGGGGGGGFGGGGGGMGGQAMTRPSTPGLGGSRPNFPSGGGAGGPGFTRPTPSSPSISRPQISRPSGGVKPSTRPAGPPAGSLTRPGSRPELGLAGGGGGAGGGRPDLSRPGLPNRPTTRPTPESPRPNTRPSFPGLDGGTASSRPGFEFPQTRPGTGGRPTPLPNRPGAPGGRPGIGLPESGISGLTRPGLTRPAGDLRPTPGDLGDFLDLTRPLRPETRPTPGTDLGALERPAIGLPDRPRPETRPGLPNPRPDTERPGTDGRPGIGNITRPETRPVPDRRPGSNGRPIINNRPIDIGSIQGNNQIINNRPTWVNINNNQFNNIHNQWQNQIGGLHNWQNRNPDRLNYFDRWGNNVRDRWHHHHHDWFGPDWWHGHRHGWCGWHYGYRFNYHGWYYWWNVPTYTNCVNWFTWSAPASVWAQPVYYDYGQGGNVVYEDNRVYVNNTPVASADEFAESAALLATVPPPANEAEAETVEWLPLGTFAVTTDIKEVEPTRVIQLAVSKTGIISGTLYNSTTDQAYTIQGQVDKNTQRVAFRVGESQNIVIETGLYNLTQDEAPVLVHYGKERVENWLFVRLENPDPSSTQPQP